MNRYLGAKEQAEELEGIARRLKSVLDTQYQPCMKSLYSCWQGEGADLFCEKGNSLYGEFSETAQKLMKASAAIYDIAEKKHRAEIRMYEL